MSQLLSNREADEIGESYIRKYYSLYPNDSLCVDIEGFATDYLGLKIVYVSFAGENEDTIGFLGDGITRVCVSGKNGVETAVFPRKTVVIDKYLLRITESARKRFTIAHETAHYLLAKISPEFTAAKFHREYDSERVYDAKKLKDLLAFSENRADRLAAALMMPRFNVVKAMERFAENRKFTVYGETIMLPEDKRRLQCMADGLGVSFTALQIRLRDFGMIEYRSFDDFVSQDYIDGDFDDSDIEYDRRFGSLSPSQTYLIHRSRRENERAEQRLVKCPACGFRMANVTTAISGTQQLKCRKCGFNEPLNFAYFRKNSRSPSQIAGSFGYVRKKR